MSVPINSPNQCIYIGYIGCIDCNFEWGSSSAKRKCKHNN